MDIIFQEHLFHILNYNDNNVVVTKDKKDYRFPIDASMRFIASKNSINLDLLRIIALRMPFSDLIKLITMNSSFINSLTKFFWTTYINRHFQVDYDYFNTSSLLKKKLNGSQLARLLFLMPDLKNLNKVKKYDIYDYILQYNDDVEKLELLDQYYLIDWTIPRLRTNFRRHIGFYQALDFKKIKFAEQEKQTASFKFYYNKNPYLSDDDLYMIIRFRNKDIIDYIAEKNVDFFGKKVNFIQAIINGEYYDLKDKIYYLDHIDSLYPNPGYSIYVSEGCHMTILQWLYDNNYSIIMESQIFRPIDEMAWIAQHISPYDKTLYEDNIHKLYGYEDNISFASTEIDFISPDYIKELIRKKIIPLPDLDKLKYLNSNMFFKHRYGETLVDFFRKNYGRSYKKK